jgi:hypothetical protein
MVRLWALTAWHVGVTRTAGTRRVPWQSPHTHLRTLGEADYRIIEMFNNYANGASAELQLQMFQQTELHLSQCRCARIASQSHEINPCRSKANNATRNKSEGSTAGSP